MKKIIELQKGDTAVISSVSGEARFVSRITSIGIIPGCKVTIIKNEKRRPLLVYSRDTMIALNRKECEGILVEAVLAQNEGGAA